MEKADYHQAKAVAGKARAAPHTSQARGRCLVFVGYKLTFVLSVLGEKIMK